MKWVTCVCALLLCASGCWAELDRSLEPDTRLLPPTALPSPDVQRLVKGLPPAQ